MFVNKLNEDMTMFMKLLENRENLINLQLKSIQILKNQISNNTDKHKLEPLNKLLNRENKILRHHRSIIEFMRIPTNEDDKIYRNNVLSKFCKIIDKSIPDNFPIVLHGTSNLGVVRDIIKSGGLLTPKQKKEYDVSFASLIDVTYKSNVTVSLQFAENVEPYMPYGALFAFSPQEDEIANVINTGKNGEVDGGVNGVNFKKEPARLYGIITTPENVEMVKQWCKQYGWPTSKVFTHGSFIKQMEVIVKNSKKVGTNKKI